MSSDHILLAAGPRGLKQTDGTRTDLERIGQQLDRIVSQLHGQMYEQALRLNMFFAANQAEQAVSVDLTTTYTGLCLNNPAGNTKNLVPRQISFGINTHQVALAGLGLLGGYAAAGVVTHASALVTYSTMLGDATAASGLADDECTIVGTPLVLMPFISTDIITTGAPAKGIGLVDVGGSIIIPPGAYVAIWAETAVTGFFGITWEEVPR